MEIKDKAKIIGLTNPKNGKPMGFKGHTTIELKDIVTGEVKKYEDDNMFTTAIGQMVAFASRHNYYNTWNPYTSHTYNLLGGLIIFREAVDTNSLYPEAGNLPVGYGAIGDTNSYTGISEWGIYNTQESDTSAALTKKMVWDFSTSHANGKISAVCLSHRNAGIFGAGTVSGYHNTGRTLRHYITTGLTFAQSSKGRSGRNIQGSITKGSNLSLNDAGIGDFCLDSVNDRKYQFRVCNDGLGIISFSTHPEKFDMFRDSRNWQSYDEDTYSADFSGYGSYVYHFYNPDEKVLYFWMMGSNVYNVGNNTTVKIHKFDMTTQTFTKDWQTMKFTTDGSGNSTAYSGTLVVTNTAGYYLEYDYGSQYYVRKYNFSGDTTTIVSIGNGNISPYNSVANNTYILNGIITFTGVIRRDNYDCYNILFDTSLDQVRWTNAYLNGYDDDRRSRWGNIPPIDNTQVVFLSGANAGESQYSSNSMNFQQYESDNTDFGNAHSPVNYLGTINNLSESIVKTAQQTMKVTYTITAVELE